MITGVLFLHGFSGGPYEVEPFVHYIEQRTDWVISVPTFSGHGDAEHLTMRGYKAEHWMMEAEIAYRQLQKQVDDVIVVGFSMGGVIAMYLSIRYPVKKLVLLSAAVKYLDPTQLVKDIRAIAQDMVYKKLEENELFARYKDKFKNVPLSATVEFMKVVKKTEPYIKNIQCPTFIVQGRLDGIVPNTTAQILYNKIHSQQKQMYISDCGKHHICYSDDCEEWFDAVFKFIR
ncbi:MULTISPECIES: alpha/beta hydrolase [Solibacillus]|uniref:Alpha/beta fold hydrolase n=1 Tax=Solibacillus merdavium TaxID=2762218 RepID=A0ABR8XPE4_9BACL|nr:alpha/beta fold hydrolase [Solibacillus merdavium]MBD8033791.1 alpha/beta fold hydrolase [Solibacillus merdavium]